MGGPVLYHTILYYTIPYYTIPYYTILYYTILYYTILYYTILYYAILYYAITHYTILYFTILYHTVLYHIGPEFRGDLLFGSSLKSWLWKSLRRLSDTQLLCTSSLDAQSMQLGDAGAVRSQLRAYPEPWGDPRSRSTLGIYKHKY